jgi:predicted flap endonuclease-1-like 5' DNA nuclease
MRLSIGRSIFTVPYSALNKLASLALVAFWSVQAQVTEEDRGRWWFWLVLLVVASAVIAWLLGREANQSPSRPVAVERPTDAPLPAPPPVRLTTPPVTVMPEPPSAESEPMPEPKPATIVAEVAAVQAQTDADSAGVTPPPPLSAPDDLTRIEGIGPKIRTILQAAGIRTFADLADADATHLKQILVDAGLRIHNPASWPQQAALAQTGQWDALKTLQSQLSAGRRG